MVNKVPVAVLASGNGSNLQALMDFSKREHSHFFVAVVVANRKNAYALSRAKLAHIPNFLVDHRQFLHRPDFERAVLDILKEHGAKIVVLAGFMRVLSPLFLAQFSKRILNIHPSILPKYPGLGAIEQALLASDRLVGCTVHHVSQDVDLGDILAQSTCEIEPGEPFEHIKNRIHALEHELLPRVTNEYCKLWLQAGLD